MKTIRNSMWILFGIVLLSVCINRYSTSSKVNGTGDLFQITTDSTVTSKIQTLSTSTNEVKSVSVPAQRSNGSNFMNLPESLVVHTPAISNYFWRKDNPEIIHLLEPQAKDIIGMTVEDATFYTNGIANRNRASLGMRDQQNFAQLVKDIGRADFDRFYKWQVARERKSMELSLTAYAGIQNSNHVNRVLGLMNRPFLQNGTNGRWRP